MGYKNSEKPEILFSVIIPTYNYADTLPRAIKSVLLQAGDDFDLLVVDDGSTDNTTTVVQAMMEEGGGNFRYIKRNNVGPAATRNFGISETKGKYLIFLDADDELTPNALMHYRRMLDNELSIGMLAGGHISKNQHGKTKIHPMGAIVDKPKERLKAYLLDKSLALSNGAVAISRDVFDAYRYPEQFRASEDVSMFAFVLANFKVISINAALAVIYKHDDSLRHNVTHATAAGLLIVDEVFDSQRMPSEVQVLKTEFLAQRCLSLFRTLFLAGEYNEARRFYHQAIRTKPAVIFRTLYLGKYLRSWVSLKSLLYSKG